MKPNDLRSAVKRVLSLYPSSKDNDIYLYTWICNDIWMIDLRSISALDFLQQIDAGRIPRPDSVTRMRRELQVEIPELRGKTWATRHAEAEDVRLQKQSLHRAAIAETAR
jgi:hypothetical protein